MKYCIIQLLCLSMCVMHSCNLAPTNKKLTFVVDSFEKLESNASLDKEELLFYNKLNSIKFKGCEIVSSINDSTFFIIENHRLKDIYKITHKANNRSYIEFLIAFCENGKSIDSTFYRYGNLFCIKNKIENDIIFSMPLDSVILKYYLPVKEVGGEIISKTLIKERLIDASVIRLFSEKYILSIDCYSGLYHGSPPLTPPRHSPPKTHNKPVPILEQVE